MRKFYRFLRVLSATTLFLFCWSYMPLFQLAAWAAEPPATRGRGDTGTGGGSRPDKIGAQGPGTTGERFEKALEEIREKVGKVEVKALWRGCLP